MNEHISYYDGQSLNMKRSELNMRLISHMDDEKPCKKRLSEIGGQEIINLYDGGKLGVVADVDLLIDDDTGNIEALLIPDSRSLFSFFSDKNYIEVPWESVRKIGQDTLIVDLGEKSDKKKVGY